MSHSSQAPGPTGTLMPAGSFFWQRAEWVITSRGVNRSACSEGATLSNVRPTYRIGMALHPLGVLPRLRSPPIPHKEELPGSKRSPSSSILILSNRQVLRSGDYFSNFSIPDFAPNAIASTSINSSDFTIFWVPVLYLMKCAVFK